MKAFWRLREAAFLLTLILGLLCPRQGNAKKALARTTQVRPTLQEQVDTSEVIPLLPVWRVVGQVALKFDAFHPQGLYKIGDEFFLSAVEVQDGKKKGVGHLFVFDVSGTLVREANLGDGTVFHPGGLDFDGTQLWVPLAEYKPRSTAVVYKVDPKLLQATPAFHVTDHIGALVYNRELKTVVGLNWGGEYFYEWSEDGTLIRKVKNDYDNVDYQDCKFVPGPAMLCGGVISNAQGRLDLIDLLDFGRVTGIWSIPRTPNKTLMTRNPMTVEQKDGVIRYYFLPEDHFGTLYIYELQ